MTAGPRAPASPYGRFDEATHEYVISRPDTPTPWLNYLGQGGYGGIISNTAGGFSFDRDPRERRVTRYRYNAIPGRPAGALRLPAGPGDRALLEPHLAAREARPRRLRMPPRTRLHAHPGARSTASRPSSSTSSRRPAPAGPARASCGCSGSATRHASAAPAHLLVRRVRLLRRAQRPAEPGLVAAHRLEPARRQRDRRLDPVPPDHVVPRGQRARRPAGPATATTSWVAVGDLAAPDRRRDGRAIQRRVARAATPSARSPTTSSSARARSAGSCSSWASPTIPGRSPASWPATRGRPRSTRRSTELRRGLGRLPAAASPSRRRTPTRPRCSTSGTRSSAGPR